MKINLGDPHHCKCYSIDPQEIEDFRRELTNLGFTYELQEDHGQVFGLVLRVSEYLQLHIKVMPDGTIEGEMEPPLAYPFAHINPEHCYSAHKEIGELFDLLPPPVFAVIVRKMVRTQLFRQRRFLPYFPE